MRTSLKILSCLSLALLSLASCERDDAEEPVWQPTIADHTVLMYLIADNTGTSPSLSDDIQVNAEQAKSALLKEVSQGTINLVIYKDNDKRGDKLPTLSWIYKNNKEKLDTVPLLTYDAEVDSTDPEEMKKVLQATFSKFDTKIKGMTIGGHALGWEPSDEYKASASAKSTEIQYIGIDCDTGNSTKTGEMDIWELREVFEQTGIKPDYLLLDCCNAANIEIAYELKSVIHYLIASVAEIVGEGFPYYNVITRLAQCHTTEALPAALSDCALYYYDANKNGIGATSSVLDLSKAEAIGSLFQTLTLNGSNASEWQEMLKETESYYVNRWVSNYKWQEFGRSIKSSRYLFYDLEDILKYLDADGTYAQDYTNALAQFVIANNYTSWFDYNITINRCSGVTITPPQVFCLLNAGDKFASAYKKTLWGKMLTETSY